MTLATKPAPHQQFMQALRDIDPILAGVYENVQAQQPSDSRWQYIWLGYQQDHNVLTPGHEAEQIFTAFTQTQREHTNPDDDFAIQTATVLANPYHHLVDDFERAERRWIDEMSFRQVDDEPKRTAQDRRSLDDLLQALRDDLDNAADLIAKGLMRQDQTLYAKGIAILERVYDCT